MVDRAASLRSDTIRDGGRSRVPVHRRVHDRWSRGERVRENRGQAADRLASARCLHPGRRPRAVFDEQVYGMNDERILEAWAPDGELWTPRAKPVPAANRSRFSTPAPSIGPYRSPDVSRIPSARGPAAIVVEPPGIDSVLMGLALATPGQRPVRLYYAKSG